MMFQEEAMLRLFRHYFRYDDPGASPQEASIARKAQPDEARRDARPSAARNIIEGLR